MPFGIKEVPKKPHVDLPPSPDGKDETLKVDFNLVYQELFKPVLNAAGLQPFRADDEQAAGDILKDMFAELVTADFVLADISILNANVFYELGIRHGIGPRGVICLHAGWADRPFDVAPQRTFKYDGRLFRVGWERDQAWQEALEKEKRALTETIRNAVTADRTTEGSPVYSNLPKLKPVDPRRIETARFKYYQALAQEWEERVETANREGRPEDILTLANDVPSPYYRRTLLLKCADALLALCRFSQAEKIYAELGEDLEGSGSLDEFRVKCQLALIANRLGRTQEAKVKLDNLSKEMPGDPEAQGLLGRVYKDMWRARWATDPPKVLDERLRAAQSNVALARAALASYEVAFRRDVGSYYNGVNVVTAAALIDHVAQRNGRSVKPALTDFEDVVAAVRVAATCKLEQAGEAVWARASLGELYLVLGRAQEAYETYEQATADPDLTWFNIRSMLEQVQLFNLLEYQPAVVRPVLELLQARCDERARPHASFRKVAICSGHMIDLPDRTRPRFPRRKEAVVGAEIARQLQMWEIEAGDLGVCGGARGADILFAEECLRRGAHVRLLLAKEIDDFVEGSVRLEKSDWVQRFHALRERCEVATQPERLGKVPTPLQAANASQFIDVYARNNLWVINTARVEASSSGNIHALLVWDEQPTGDGPGGTSDFELRVRQLGGHREIVNPTKLSESLLDDRASNP
jgi:tetratricopeptide (TPR) repeat protein